MWELFARQIISRTRRRMRFAKAADDAEPVIKFSIPSLQPSLNFDSWMFGGTSTETPGRLARRMSWYARKPFWTCRGEAREEFMVFRCQPPADRFQIFLCLIAVLNPHEYRTDVGMIQNPADCNAWKWLISFLAHTSDCIQ